MPDGDQIPFDYLGAKKEGYTDGEIMSFLKDKYNFEFDLVEAKKSGYSDKEIADYITAYEPPKKKGLGGVGASALDTSLMNGGIVGNGNGQSDEKQILTNAITQTPFKKNEHPFDQTKEEAIKGATTKLNDIMYGEGEDWKDPIKAAIKGIDKSTNIKDAAEHLGVKALTEQSLMPDGFEAKQTLASTILGKMGDDNLTSKVLREKANNYDKKVAPLNEIQTNEDLSNASEDYLKYNFGGQINNAAIKYYADKHPDFKKELKASGIDINDPFLADRIPSGKRGQIKSEFFNDPDINAYLQKENPNLIPAFQVAEKNHLTDDIEYGINQVANKVSKARDDEGLNDQLINFYGNNAKEATNAVAESVLDTQELEIYNKHIKDNQEKYIDAPSLVEGIASGIKNTLSGTAKLFTEPFTSEKQSVRNQWEKEASNVSADPKGTLKFLNDTGNVLGFLMTLGTTGNVTGLNPVNALTLATTGDIIQQSREKFRGEPVKAALSGILNVGLYRLLGKDIFPVDKAKAAFDKAKPELDKIVENLTAGRITADAARKEASTTFGKMVDFAGGTLSQNAKITAELTGLQGVNRIFDKISMDDATFKKLHPDDELAQGAKHNFLSFLTVAGLGKYGQMKNANNLVSESIYEAASKPNEYKRQAEDASKSLTYADVNEIKDNIDYAAKIKQELDKKGISPKNQKRYLFEALQEKAKNDLNVETGEPTLDKTHKEAIKEHQEVKERILAGEDHENIITEKEQKILDEQEKTKTELERLKIDNELDNKKVDAKIEGIDGRESEANRIKLQELKEEKRRINEDYQKEVAKLTPQEKPLPNTNEEPILKKEEPISTVEKNGGEGSGIGDKTGLILYHGSPHSFENFDISKLGSGEGKQAKNETIPSNTEGTQPKPPEEEVNTTQLIDKESKPTEEGTGEPPKEPPSEKVEAKEGGKLNDKGILNKLYNAKNTPKAAKEGFKSEGLEYATKSQEEAEGVAKAVVDELGVDDAVLAAEAQKFDGDVNSLIFGEALNRLKEQEDAATTPEGKLEAAMKFAEVGIAYDKAARKGGRFNSAINRFYKKSPLGIVMMENAKRSEDFQQWAKPKEKSWKEFHEEMMKDPEYEAIVKEQVKERMKQERAEARKTRIKKVDDFFDKAKDQFKDGAMYSTIIPPKVITTALEGMKKAYHAGEKVAELIEKAVDYISEQLGNATWDKDKFRKEWEEKLKDPTDKKPLTDEEVKKKVLDKFRNKLKGLTDRQKEDVVVKAHKKIIESGGLDYQDFKDIIANVLGRGELTPEEAVKMQDMVKKINAVDAAAERARTERTEASLRDFRKAQIEAGAASKDLSAMLYTRPNITRRLTSMMQLNTLGIPALINNPIYNIVNTLGIRFPVGVIKSVIDRSIQGVAKALGKDIQPETNVFSYQIQKEFFKKLGLGTKESVGQFLTGLNRMDYTQKELYGQQLRPAKSIRDLYAYSKGKLKLSPAQVVDKILQASPQGWSAEIIARTLNLGDKPQRFAAEGAQASAFAKGLGLENIDYNLFIEFPREEAYMQLKKKGLSDEEAGKRADYIRDTIVKEGERSTFQQDNFLNDMLTKAFGGDKSGVGGLAKATLISPYIKIPSNAFWSYYNIVNPEVALLQSLIYTGKGIAKKTGYKERFLGDRDNTSAEKDFNEAKYWFAHAAVGVATRAVIISLVNAGVFRSGNDQNDTKKEREGEANYEPQGTVNLTKLSAWIQGKDPSKVQGGLTVSTKWLGHWGSVGNAIAKRNEDMTPEQKEHEADFLNTMFGGMELPALQEFEQGVFGNTSSLLQALNSNSGQGLNWWGINTINMFGNIVHPAALAQISRAELPYYSTSKADNFGQQLKNTMLQRSSVIRSLLNEYPPSKVGIWGDPIERKGSTIMKLFGFNNTTKDNFAQPLYEDYLKTNDIGFFPPAVMPKIGDQKLNTAQAAKLEEDIGHARKSYIAPFINDQAEIEGFNVKYSQLNKEDKKYVLQYLYEMGKNDGQEKFIAQYPQFKEQEKRPDYQKDVQKEIFRILSTYKKQ